MFDIGWTEMAVIALLTLIVIGPKELPGVMRNVGQWARKARSLAREFQQGLDDMAREAELEDAKKLIDTGRNLANPKKMVMDTLDPTGSLEEEAADLQAAVGDREPTTPAAKSPDKGSGSADQSANGPAKQPETPAAARADGPDEEAPKATIIKHPVNVAPPHSVTPPPESSVETEAKTETGPAGKDGSQKTA